MIIEWDVFVLFICGWTITFFLIARAFFRAKKDLFLCQKAICFSYFIWIASVAKWNQGTKTYNMSSAIWNCTNMHVKCSFIKLNHFNLYKYTSTKRSSTGLNYPHMYYELLPHQLILSKLTAFIKSLRSKSGHSMPQFYIGYSCRSVLYKFHGYFAALEEECHDPNKLTLSKINLTNSFVCRR